MHTPILEALDVTPDDVETWEVLADWLEDHGDPRAALMRLTRDRAFPDVAVRPTPALAAAVKAAERAWFPEDDVGELGLVWRHGFVELAHLTPRHRELMYHPALRFVRELNVSGFAELSLPARHQLRVLRCDSVQRLPSLPPLELLVLLNSPATAWVGATPTRVVRVDGDRRVHVIPRHGLVNFRALPPELPAPGNGSDEWRANVCSYGSDIDSPYRALKTCGACGGDDLAQIFDGFWKVKDAEYSKWLTWREEAWCRSCGTFTRFERTEED